MTTVTLYEDNAGHLYLHRDGDEWYVADLEQAESTFAADAADYAENAHTSPITGEGSVSGWYGLSIWPHVEDLRNSAVAVAQWQDGTVTLLSEHHGNAAKEYIGAA